jgi:hypothetical protein
MRNQQIDIFYKFIGKVDFWAVKNMLPESANNIFQWTYQYNFKSIYSVWS